MSNIATIRRQIRHLVGGFEALRYWIEDSEIFKIMERRQGIFLSFNLVGMWFFCNLKGKHKPSFKDRMVRS